MNSNSIELKVSSGKEIGLGHIGRVMALAELYPFTYFNVQDEASIRWIKSKEFKLLDKEKCEILIIDQKLPVQEQELLFYKEKYKTVVLIDNNGPGRRLADLCIDPPTNMKWNYSKKSIGGFDNCLIRKEWFAGSNNFQIKNYKMNCAVSCGASDIFNLNNLISDTLLNLGHKITRFDSLFENNFKSNNFVSNNYTEKILESDIVFTTFGHTVLECIAAKKPVAFFNSKFEDFNNSYMVSKLPHVFCLNKKRNSNYSREQDIERFVENFLQNYSNKRVNYNTVIYKKSTLNVLKMIFKVHENAIN